METYEAKGELPGVTLLRFKQYLKGSLPRMCKGSFSLMSLPEVEDHEEASRKISGMEA